MIDIAAEREIERHRAAFERRWFQLRWHAKQQALIHCPRRFVGVPAGRRSGKTEISKRKLVRSLAEVKPWGDPNYFYGAPTERQAKKLAWNDLVALIPVGWLASEPNKSDLIIETKFGSSLHVIGFDKPQRAEGMAWDGGVIDESCDIKPGTVDLSVGPALMDRSGWLWRIGVPKRQGIGAVEFRAFCERANRGESADEACFTWPSSDIQPAANLRYYQERMDPVDYAEQFNASWQSAAGRIFHTYDESYNLRACDFDPLTPLIVSCDFNVDPMAWAVGHKREFGLEWFDEIWLRDANTPKALDVLWEKYGQTTQGTIQFFGDATGRARKTAATQSDYMHILSDDRFRNRGATVHFPKSNPATADRFSACNAMFRTASGNVRMFVDPRCEHLRVDLLQRSYKPNSREPNDAGDIGHISDAMGYAVYMLYPVAVEFDEPEIVIRTPDTSPRARSLGRGRMRAGRRL